jgi:hypothetical protein
MQKMHMTRAKKICNTKSSPLMEDTLGWYPMLKASNGLFF